jgi:hypothetical protein
MIYHREHGPSWPPGQEEHRDFSQMESNVLHLHCTVRSEVHVSSPKGTQR